MLLKQILKDWGLEVLILFLFVWVLLPNGPGITFDSVSFDVTGENFFSKGQYLHWGKEGTEFAAHRFPLYTLVLQLFAANKVTLIIFQLLLFAGLLLSFRWFLAEQKSPKYFFLLLATFPIFLTSYCLWTESLYGLLLICLFALLKKEEDYQPLWTIGLVIALLCLTRMVGIVAAAALLMAYIIHKRAVRGWVIFGIGAVILTSWTLLGAFWLGETARTIAWHPVDVWDIFNLLRETGNWLVPLNVEDPTLPIIFGAVILTTPIYIVNRCWDDRSERSLLFWFLIIHFYGYLLFILLAKSFIDASVAFGFRTLLPIFLNFIGLLVVVQAEDIFPRRTRAKIKFMFPKVIIVCVALNISGILGLRNNGVGYSSAEWLDYGFVDELNKYNPSVIYTNNPAPLLYHSRMKIENMHLLPEKKNLFTLEEKETYEAEMDVMLHYLDISADGKIFWIRNGITEDVYPTYEELTQNPNYEVIYDDWLCVILKAK